MTTLLMLAALAAAPRDDLLLGGDLSMLPAYEQHGAVFRDHVQPADLLALLKARGCTCARVRLFVEPDHRDDGVIQDLAYVTALGARIKAAGLRFLLDLHYSDTWADPQHQWKPKSWAALDFGALVQRVEDYSRECVATLARAGALPDVVQLGNEITPGMLWPDGQLSHGTDRARQWDQLCALLKAGRRGVKAASATPRIMLHLDRGGDWGATRWFLDQLAAHGVEFDVLGQSYYPWWHGSLDDLKRNLTQTANKYKKDIVVVETAYPWTSNDYWTKQKHLAYPLTPNGQRQFLRDLLAAVAATPDGHGKGVIWWFPEAIAIGGLHAWNGGATAWFDTGGAALPVLDAFTAASETR